MEWIKTGVDVLAWIVVVAAFPAIKFLLPKLIDNRLASQLQHERAKSEKELEEFRSTQQLKLEGMKAEQQKELESFKADQQAKLERTKGDQQSQIEQMKHALQSRLSRVHEKEFEVLPRLCSWLFELQGHISKATEMTFEFYPDFVGWPEEKVNSFLSEEPHMLSARQAEELRSVLSKGGPKSARDYYSRQVKFLNMTRAKDEIRLFTNYFLQQRVFITKENDIRSKIDGAKNTLVNALSSYEVAQKDEAWALLKRLPAEIDAVESAVQARLNAL